MTKKKAKGSRKKARSGQEVAAGDTSVSAENGVVSEGAVIASGWPKIFPNRRTVIGLSTLVLLLSLLLFYHAAFDNLLWLKRLAAYGVGFSNWTLLPADSDSYSIALVIWALLLMGVGAVIHPCVGLAAFVILRPCVDGNTYPEANFYFLWGSLFIMVLWGVRLLLRGGNIRFGKPLLLLAALLVVATITSGASINFNTTYRSLLLWFCYFVLFVLASNSLRDRVSLGVVLGALAVSVGVQALYAILSFHYILPFLRWLLSDPEQSQLIAQQFFDASALSPAATHRFQMNRAFGNILEPNALAGFLILVIPFQVVGAILGWRSLRAARLAGKENDSSGEGTSARRGVATIVGGLSLLFGAALVYYIGAFRFFYDIAYITGTPEQQAIAQRPIIALALVLGVALGACFFMTTLRRGLLHVGQIVRAFGFMAFSILSVWALWLSFSRGGMLALFVASAVGFALLWVGEGRVPAFVRRRLFPATAFILILIVLGVVLGAPPMEDAAFAQTPEGQAPGKLILPGGVEGIDYTMADFLRTATFQLRWSYWTVGLHMYRDHFWTGVGLGNFGQAYPVYQIPGAGDVQEAHNGYLQLFCETGLVGGLLFIAFWLYFVWWGVRRIVREKDRHERLVLVGLFTGVLAFLLHALIDMNFSIVTLAMFVMVVAGLFFARAQLSDAELRGATGSAGRHRLPHQVCAGVFLVLAALVMGLSTRVYFQDFALSRGAFFESASRDEIQVRRNMGQFFMKQIFDDLAKNPKKRPYRPVQQVMALIPEREKLDAFGAIYVPQAPEGVRRITKEELLLPPNALLFISQPEKGFEYARLGAEAWLAEFARIDTGFPYNPENAYDIALYYRFLSEVMNDEEQVSLRKGYIAEYARWAGEAVRRAPKGSDYHLVYAQALLAMGNVGDTARQMEYFQESVEQYRLASQSAPYRAQYWYYYASSVRNLSDAYATLGNKARSDSLKLQARRAYGRASDLVELHTQAGIQ